MLYKLNNNIFICGLLSICMIGCWLNQDAFDMMAVGTLLAFISQMSLLLYFSKEGRDTYSEKTLFVVVFLYSLMLGTVYMTLSYIYEGDTFMLTKADAINYYNLSMRAYDVGFFPNMAYIAKLYEFDDWGSFTFDCFLMSIIPDKLFLNFVYMLLGGISSVMLFRICRHYMPDSYAFVAALAYCTSSFLILFHCTFLKESLFTTIIISTMYNLCRLINKESCFAPFGLIVSTGLLFFFRPAVAAFIIMSIFAYFAIKQHGSALSLFMYTAGVVIFFVALQYMMSIADRYSSGAADKLEVSGNAKAYSGGFNTFVNLFGGFFGPFPTLFTKPDSAPTTLQFYGPGLVYRLFLVFPFFAGIYFIFKKKVLELFPITIFILAEMLASGMVVASLDLRKVMPHISFTYIVSFYGLSKWQEANVSRRIPEASIYVLAIGLMVMWNIVKKT